MMKKTLITVCTTAIVAGAASTAFAAANPFSDVPADHWAYDAVAQLAADGVIEGYGDATFQGDKNITRYEMAQMVAKAMAKKDVSAADKAAIDKLSAEFADELGNLGVRVANLEKNADKVKWGGVFESTYTSTRHDTKSKATKDRTNVNEYVFRLEPVAEVSDHWKVHARIDANGNYSKDTSGSADLKRVWAEGDYGKLNVKLGKLPNAINLISITDDPYSGVAVSYGDKWKVTAEAGRIDDANFGDMSRDANGFVGTQDAFKDNDDTANYQALMVSHASGKFAGDVAYQHLTDTFDQDKLPVLYYQGQKDRKDYKADIWSLKGTYGFDKNDFLKVEYAKNAKADNEDTSYSFEYDYKGATAQNPGSWGMYLAYRNLGQYASPWGTYGDGVDNGQKGIEGGVSWTVFRNIQFFAKYFNGKDRVANKDAQKLFARFDVFF